MNTTTTQSETKSSFEQAIINAFKYKTHNDIYSSIVTAYNELPTYINDIKTSSSTSILNKNIISKLSHITQRNYFIITLQISHIYETLLDFSNFDYLSKDISLLITFSNEVLSVLDIIKTTFISPILNNKCICFLNYISQNESFTLEQDQQETIHDLINTLTDVNVSESYLQFSKKRKDNIINLCQRKDMCYKMEGVSILINSFGNVNSLNEQFNLLREHCTVIYKTILNDDRRDDCVDVYFKLGEILVTMLYCCKFKIKAEDNNVNNGNNKKKINTQSYFVIETNDKSNSGSCSCNVVLNDYSSFMFLNNALCELTTQKELLLKCEYIFSLCQLLLNKLITYKDIFKLQYICYYLCKKIYFNFPQFQPQIEDTLCTVLTNICTHFTSPSEQQSIFECKQFLHYILSTTSSPSLQAKLTQTANTALHEETTYSAVDIEHDTLDLNNFNLRIGYPSYILIDAGDKYEQYIEINNDNCLIYIGFTVSTYDITFTLEKYNNTHGSFEEFMRLDRVSCDDIPSKVIIYVKHKGMYKLIYNNTYSWLTSKEIHYRLTVLHVISEV
jgi:hypothetical protein